MYSDKPRSSFWLTTIVYGIFAIIGAIGLVAPTLGFPWRSESMEEQMALNTNGGYIILAIAFTYPVYLAFCEKLDFAVSTKILITIGTLVVLVAMDVAYFFLFHQNREILKESFQIKVFYWEGVSDNILLCIALFASQICLLILGFAPKILKTPHRVLQFLLTLMATFGIFFLIFIIIAILGFIISVGIMNALTSLSGNRESTFDRNDNNDDKTIKIFDNGYERTLTQVDSYMGHDRYKDDTGSYWFSDDNGSTFYEDK